MPFVEKITVIPEIWTAPGTQTFESVNAESVHQVIQVFVKGLITDFTDMEQSVFDGMFEHAEASMQQPHSSSKQPTQTAQERAKEERGRNKERRRKRLGRKLRRRKERKFRKKQTRRSRRT